MGKIYSVCKEAAGEQCKSMITVPMGKQKAALQAERG